MKDTRRSHRRWQALRAQLIDERDHVCSICRCLLDPDLPASHPRAIHADHIVALSRGGALLDPSNVRLTCRTCNLQRGAGPKQPAKPETSREW